VNQSAADFDAAGLPHAGSLAAAAGEPFDTREIARQLLEQLDREYDLLRSGERAMLEACWSWRLGLLGRDVVAEDTGGESHRGRLVRLSFDELELARPGGEVLRLAPESVRALAAQ
jgi:hypothetical protein